MQNIKQNLLLFLAIILPVIFIGILYLASKFPTEPIIPSQNFIYSITNYNFGSKISVNYQIEDGKLVRRAYDSQFPDKVTEYVPVAGEPTLYEYDFTSSTARVITFDEASKRKYSLKFESKEGYTITQDYGGGGGFFYSGPTYPSVYVHDRNKRSKLNLDLNPSRNESFQFIGWFEE